MALISDTDYVLHALRVGYLRDVEDPYGPRVITLDPAYTANPYIVASALADSDRYPQLNQPASPNVSEDEQDRPSGFPGARLKSSQTIMGGRTGGLGLRVNGKTSSTSRRASRTSGKAGVRNFVSEKPPVPPPQVQIPAPPTDSSSAGAAGPHSTAAAPPSNTAVAQSAPDASSWINIDSDSSESNTAPRTRNRPEGKATPPSLSSSPEPTVQVQQATAPEEPPAPVTKVVQFIPKFKGAAEMERRRRVRMAARRAGGPNLPIQAPAKALSFDTSSEEEEDEDEEPQVNPISDVSDEDEDEFDVDQNTGVTLDEGDEFDPVFPTTRTASDSASDATSLFSTGPGSVPTSAGLVSSSLNMKTIPTAAAGGKSTRLSPVSEHNNNNTTSRRYHRPQQPSGDRPMESSNIIVPRRSESSASTATAASRSRGDSTGHSHPPITSSSTSASTPSTTAELKFTKKKVQPIKPLKSTLSSMLASSSSSSNPFTEFYAAISGRGEPTSSTTLQVYFPHAKGANRGKAMELNVRKDSTVEEVIGYALWRYWEDGWVPKLDDGLPPPDDGNGNDAKRKIKLSALGWVLRIAEDDGEVDDDFPPPDRMGKIIKFNSDAYAILEATPAQIQQNQILEPKIQRRPSRITATKKKDTSAGAGASTAGASTNAKDRLGLSNMGAGGPPIVYGSTPGSVLSTSLGPSTSHGPQIFLRIRVADTADAVHISTTIPVSAGVYMQEALELVCRKRKLQNPNDYALLLADMSILIPLDRTVASLQGKRELLLVKRSMLPQMGVDVMKGVGRTTDPNASIFKRMSDTPEQQYSSALDYTAAYKKYTIYRKVPMLVTRQERTLAIDGGYIHIMPSTNKAKAVFDSGKTSSYDIKSIADCQQSAKASSLFKLIINRGATKKRYDFEAESPKLAAEIVQTIKNLKAALERSGTVGRSRKSRQVV